MTRDDIIRMAWECGILMRSHEHQEEPTKIERFAALVAAHEREEIVRECITTMTNLESDIKQQFPWKKEEVVPTSGHIQKLKEHFGVGE